MNQKKPEPYLSKAALIATGLVLLMLTLCAGTYGIISILSPNSPSIRYDVDLSSAHGLADHLEQQMKQWQDSLFLETYAVTYRLDDTNSSDPTLTGTAYFQFIGKREDWLGKLVSYYNANHLIVDVEVDVIQREVTEFSYSHGEPFGYRAPLNISNWPKSEGELLRICDNYGGSQFRDTYDVELVHVNATVTRPSREWTAAYNASPGYFECLVKFDTGDILIKQEESDWQRVGNLQEIK